MDKKVENLLSEFVIRAAERFDLSFEDALAAVCRSKVANDIVATNHDDNRCTEDLCSDLFEEISKGY